MLETPVRISPRITVGPAPAEQDDIDRLAARGFKTIVNLSKKGELNQILKPEEEGALVESLGMDYLHLPLSLSNVKEKDIDEFCHELSEASTPAYIHCRIGQRSCPLSLIFHARMRKLNAEQILKKAEKLGLHWDAPIIPSIITRYLKKKGCAGKDL